MSDWRKGELGELATGIRGVSYTPDQLREFKGSDTVTLLRANNIQSGSLNFNDTQIVPRGAVSDGQVMRAGDIAVCMSNGSKSLVGKAASLATEPNESVTVGAFCSIFRPTVGADPGFVKYLFQSASYRKQLDFSLAGSAINNLRNSELQSFPVLVPPPSEQRGIAKVLDTLDTTMRQTEAIIEKLKQVKQGLLHDLLTRGIDANGELRPPQSQAPHLYKDSPLGSIPKEWQATPIGKIADLQVGYAFKSECFRDSGDVRLLRGDNVGYGSPDWNAAKFLDGSLAAQFNEYALSAGDVVVGMDRSFTKSGAKFSLIGEADLPCLLVQRVGRFFATECELAFLRVLTLWPDFHRRLMAQQKGMDIPHLSKTEILEPCVPVPAAEEQRDIATRIGAVEARLAAEQRTSEKLKLEKSGLVDDLLTGRVRVTPLLT